MAARSFFCLWPPACLCESADKHGVPRWTEELPGAGAHGKFILAAREHHSGTIVNNKLEFTKRHLTRSGAGNRRRLGHGIRDGHSSTDYDVYAVSHRQRRHNHGDSHCYCGLYTECGHSAQSGR